MIAMSNYSYNRTYILGLSFISALGGYLFGFDFAVISGALPFLRDQFGLNSWWEGMVAASLAVGAALGWGVDRLLSTSPFGFIVLTLLGFVAGVVNVVRSAGVASGKR